MQKLPSRSVPLEQSEARGKKCDTNLRKEFALVALFFLFRARTFPPAFAALMHAVEGDEPKGTGHHSSNTFDDWGADHSGLRSPEWLYWRAHLDR